MQIINNNEIAYNCVHASLPTNGYNNSLKFPLSDCPAYQTIEPQVDPYSCLPFISGILKVVVVQLSLRSLTLSSSQRVSYSTGNPQSVKTLAKIQPPWSRTSQPSWEHPWKQENNFTLNYSLPICQCMKQHMYLHSNKSSHPLQSY